MALLYGIFIALMMITCGYAAVAGGRDARIACAMMILAASLTYFVTAGGARLPLLMLDTALLLGLILVALRSRSYWPLWITGLHLVTVVEGVASFLAPAAPIRVLHAVTGFFAIPMLVIMAWGIFLDRRGYRHADGADPSH